MAHPVAVPAAQRRQQLHLIEDDEPRLVRPQPVKIVRPIPQRAVKEFYDQVASSGIVGQTAHDAIMMSHEWHQKWATTDAFPLHSPDYCQLERLNPRESDCGAKNPSPPDYSTGPFRKRIRLPLTENALVNEPVLIESPVPKRIASLSPSPHPEAPLVDSHYPSEMTVQGSTDSSITEVFKPVARRVARPKVSQNEYIPPPQAGIPRTVRSHRYARSGSVTPPLSPLTIPSVSTGSYQSRERQHAYNVVEDDGFIPSTISHPVLGPSIAAHVSDARDGILHALAVSGGETKSLEFKSALEALQDHFLSEGIDTRNSSSNANEGKWLTLTKPTFFANLGENDNGDPLYTLGRMSFDMFSPTALVCSLQGNFNSVERVGSDSRARILYSVPKVLQKEVLAGETTLRTYK